VLGLSKENEINNLDIESKIIKEFLDLIGIFAIINKTT
jgi:hypothetical protein